MSRLSSPPRHGPPPIWPGARALPLALLAFALCAPAGAQTAAGTRGRLLYETHCIACHSTQVHWRDARLASDWASLRAQVLRWQASAHLNWSGEDIDEVARHLNDTIYRFAPAGRVVGTARPARLGVATAPTVPR